MPWAWFPARDTSLCALSRELSLRPEWLSERRGHVEADPRGVARGQDQDNDGCHVRQHREQVARDLNASALEIKLEHRDAPEEVRAEKDAQGAPGGERRQGECDPSFAGGHPFHPERRVDDRDVGSSKAR